MAIEIKWLLPGRIVYIANRGTITVDELQNESRQLIEFLDEGEGPLVHLLTDVTELGEFPISVGLLNRTSVEPLRHPRMGWLVVITNNRMLKYLGSMVTGLSSVRYRAFTSVDEGLAFLNEVDSTLPDLLALDHDA